MRERMHFLFIAFAIVLTFVLQGCTQQQQMENANANDPLSLWEENAPAKVALVNYVNSVTKKESPDFIPVESRIAVFDLDGTLLLETDPTYFDWLLFEHRVLDDPNFKASDEQLRQARNSRKNKVIPELSASRERMVAEVYKGLTVSEFEAYVRKFMQESQPGFIGLKRGEAFYKPMVEVVKYLEVNGFKVYICSGTDRLIVRPLVKDNLAIPSRQVIGSDSTIVAKFQEQVDGLDYTYQKGDTLILGGKNLVKNLQMNKVAVIAQEIGIQPVLAFGNSSTDASMVNYAILNNKYKSLGFMLCCDDLEREYGNLEKAEKMRKSCEKNGWIPISMKNDWKTIYGYNVKKKGKH